MKPPTPAPMQPFQLRTALASSLMVLATLVCAGDPADRAVRELSPTPVKVHKVLLIGIDGVRPDVLAEVFTPNIDALIRDGVYSDQAQTGLPTVSGPSWSSMLTGVWSAKHGVVDNTFAGKRYEEFPDFLTRVERANPDLHTFAIADWTPIVSDLGGGPLISSEVDEVVTLNGYTVGWTEADSTLVAVAVDRLTTRDLDAVFVYLGDPDETSHGTSSIGAEYRAAIGRADLQVGRLTSALRSRSTYADEDWLILVSTDHGRLADGDHGGTTAEERTIFFLASGPSATSASLPAEPQIVDVAATALVHLGIDLDPDWSLDGEPIGIVAR